MQLDIVELSKAGGRQVNEDACGTWSNTAVCCCVLSDGLGGHDGGEVASKIVVQQTLNSFRRSPECSAKEIEALLHAGNEAIMDEQQRDSKLVSMRATAVILTIDIIRNLAFWGHIGDSRLYCFRQGRIVKQTRDHSVTQQMVDAGYLKPEELRCSPNRSKLLAALGGSNGQGEFDIAPVAFPVQDKDVFLLCSDGLWEYIEESELEKMLAASTSASGWLTALEEQVIARGHATQDNYSAIVVWCSDSDDTAQLL